MRLLAGLATLVAGAALAAVVAYWGWQFAAPAPIVVAPRAPEGAVQAIVAARLFGDAGADTAGPAVAAGATLGADARLVGIIAEPGERGHALFRLSGGSKLVAQGAEIVNGVTVVSIERDAVVVRDAAGEHRYVLRAAVAPAKPQDSAPAAATPKVPVSPPRIATCGPPAGYGGTLVRLNAELLSGMARGATPWQAMLEPIQGGLVVRTSDGFAAMLGLHAGDILVQANGIALGVPDDITTAVVKPLVANQGVRMIGARNGVTREIWLANAACAG
ncbi:MAG: type II secretion system protein N [Betaproteobacteria bacterium]